MSTQAVKVFLRDCRVDLHVGIYARELTQTQPVLINVELDADLPHHYDNLAEDNVARVINYGDIHHYVCVELPKLGHIGLLEAIAEKIIGFCMADQRVTAVRVRVEKTEIFPNAVGGIEIYRTR